MNYQPDWSSLMIHSTPKWLREAKFGIYTHWGVYSVPAYGPNATVYPYYMYRQGSRQYEHHIKTYGPLSKFGYKDFIPLFTGEKFDPQEWAELFRSAGAKFAGPVAEHCDGFAMWDSQLTKWNATRMGPCRDVVGELAKAIRQQGMHFMVSFHHFENWFFYSHLLKDSDTVDPRYSDLYGPIHNLDSIPAERDWLECWWEQERPTKEFHDRWMAKIVEVVDRYQPDLMWFDFALRFVQESYKKKLLAYYYNKAGEWGKEVAVTHKWHDLAPGSSIVDLELGRFDALTYHDWITDTTVDDGCGWGYLRDTQYKPLSTLVHYLIDNVSKNGCLLLNVGPKPNGEIPEQAQELLKGMGKWLSVNGEAIYGTTPWMTYGEGPTHMPKAGYFMEDQEVTYTAQDIRYTAKSNLLYAICLGWPTQPIQMKELKRLYPGEVLSIRLLGVDQELAWSLTPAGLTIIAPDQKPCDHAYVIKIERNTNWAGSS
jgi:alpha-L-fucosidase